MKLKNLTIASLATFILVGCGNSDSTTKTTGLNLPDGKTLIFFDNESSKQYLYDTDKDSSEDMNVDGKNYNMTNKNGKLFVWNHKTPTGMEEKIVMIKDDFNIKEGNLTYTDFHYLGHFHEEDNEHVFAAHSSSEFDPATSSANKKKALVALNKSLLEQEEIKQEISEALPSGEELCNFFVFEHDDHNDHNASEEASPHIALTKTGKMYIYEEDSTGLKASQSSFTLDGVTECEEDKSSIIKSGNHGVFVFSAQSQTLYLVDAHGEDFHQHSKWTGSKFLPAGFTPTQLAGISKSDDEHNHNHDY